MVLLADSCVVVVVPGVLVLVVVVVVSCVVVVVRSCVGVIVTSNSSDSEFSFSFGIRFLPCLCRLCL